MGVTTLREITADTVRAVVALEVRPDQRSFVASNGLSLAQALFSPEAWYRAIYHDDEPAGFVMLYDESLRRSVPATPRLSIWRLMVADGFQGRGIGTAALVEVIAHARSRGCFSELLVSYVPGPGCAEPFYTAAGFRATGEVDDGEVVLALAL